MIEPTMICPRCFFVPEVDRPMPPGTCDPPEAFRERRLETDRWLEYVAHLLGHLVVGDVGPMVETQSDGAGASLDARNRAIGERIGHEVDGG